MARIVRERKAREVAPGAMPEWLREAVLLGDLLQNVGLIKEIGERCRLRRQGGYCGLDVVLFFLAYFASSARTGLKKFFERGQGVWRNYAAVADRSNLPSPASMSRALGGVTHEEVRPFARWLLTEALDLRTVLSHPAAQHRDALGRSWHVFDFDPTCTALRQRALPSRADTPEPERLGLRIAEAGRCGRKRGEIMLSRSVLQHAGSSLWLDMQVCAGHGSQRAQLDSAVAAAVRVCELIAHPTEYALIRMDGQFGGIPSITSCRSRGIRFLTRCSRYALLEHPDVRRALRGRAWTLVPDSGSGPERSALDVGWVMLTPADATLHDDGTAYAPERVRIVVTRYPIPDANSKRGHVIDGVCYELFETDLDEEGWPAEQIVRAYFGRCGQENRFAQEDREAELDRIYAYEPAGQELACVIGAFVWNWRVLAGFAAQPPMDDFVPKQVADTPCVDARSFTDLPVDDAEPTVEQPPEPIEPHIAHALPATDAASTIDRARWAAHRETARKLIGDQLTVLLPGSILAKKGWSADPRRAALVCPRGQLFTWTSVSVNAKGTSHQAIFYARRGTCAECPVKANCRPNSDSPKDYTPILVIPSALSIRVRTPPQLVAPRAPKPRPEALVYPPSPTRGGLQVSRSHFLPAAARTIARAIAATIAYQVSVPHSPPQRSHPLVAKDERAMRHGRCTHAENLARYALPHDVTVRVIARASGDQFATLRRLRRAAANPRAVSST